MATYNGDHPDRVRRLFTALQMPYDPKGSPSAGACKLYHLAGYILYALEYGQPLVIDELDNGLHPLLTRKIIELFRTPAINKNGAQLIFTSHDATLLGNDCFRRDQIWFTEKDPSGATVLYPLTAVRDTDGQKIRNDRNYQKDYLSGRYGAIPEPGDLSDLFD